MNRLRAILVAPVVFAALAVPASGSASAEESGPVELRVVDRKGAPVEGAAVLALSRADGEAAEWSTAMRTDAEGTVAWPASDGEHDVYVKAGGFLDRRIVVELGPAAGRFDVLVYPAARLAGRVTDVGGEPLPGAELCATLDEWKTYPEHVVESMRSGRRCVTADEEGSVDFADLPFGSYRLSIEAEGRIPRRELLPLDGDRLGGVWTMTRGGWVTGQLIDPDEQPVAGAAVDLRHRLRELSKEGRTDAEGRFRIDHLAPGFWTAEIRPPRAARITRDGLVVREAEATDIGTLRARPGLSVEGVVLDGDDAPVPDVHLYVTRATRTRRVLQRATSDGEGRFVLGGLPDEMLTLVVRPPSGWAPHAVPEIEPPRRELEVALQAAGTVCGTVRIDEPTSPSRLRVTADAAGRPRNLQKDTGTDEVDPQSGAFCIPDVLPGGRVSVQAEAPGFWADPVEVVVRPGEEAGPVELWLRRGHEIEGRVVDPAGLPVADATVRADSGTAGWTDLSGRFRVTGIRPGMSRIRADHDDWATATRSVMVPLADEEMPELQLGSGGTIQGTVRTAADDPVPGVAIDLEEPARQTFTDLEGSFRFARVPAGVRGVTRNGVDGNYDKRRVEVVDERTHTVDFTLGGVLEGTVSRGGLPVPWASVSVAAPTGGAPVLEAHRAQHTFTDIDGSFRLPGVATGWATASVADGDQQSAMPVEVPAGASPRLDLALPERLIRGRVVRSTDDAPLQATVQWSGDPPEAVPAWGSFVTTTADPYGQTIRHEVLEMPGSSTRTRPDGSFELFVGGTGEVELLAWSPGYALESLAVDPHGLEPLEFRLGREVDVRVLLRDASGRPVGRNRVCFYAKGSTSCRIGDGSDVLQSVREGLISIVADASGFGSRILQNVELSSEMDPSERTFELTLGPGAELHLRVIGAPDGGSSVVSLIDPAGRDLPMLAEASSVDPETGDRRWKTRALEPGTWHVSVDTGGGEIVDKQVEIVPGPPIELVFP